MPDVDLPTLGPAFDLLRARWARQGRRVRQLGVEADKVAKMRGIGHARDTKRRVAILESAREEVGYHVAWSRWSASSNELAELVEQIMSQPARSVSDLAIRFDALAWLLLGDGAVVDREAERHVRVFGRELRELGAAERQARERHRT